MLTRAIFFLAFATLASYAQANPMEALLKKQIAEQRYQETKAKQAARQNSRRAKKPPAPKRLVYKTPPHKIILISGIGKKLAAHLVIPQKRQSTKPQSTIIVRAGDKLDYDAMRFKVVLINERCVVLRRGSRRYEISFITP